MNVCIKNLLGVTVGGTNLVKDKRAIRPKWRRFNQKTRQFGTPARIVAI